MRNAAALALALLLAACSGEPARLAVPPETSDLRVRASASTVSVTEVTLPAYADASEIAVQTATGLIEPVGGVLWADDPPRALTNALVRNLGAITGAAVAADPWPLDGNPAAEVTVRVEQMLVGADGVLRLTGQFAVRRDAFVAPGRLRSFAIAVPVASTELPDIARAHDAAWRELAEEIARNL